MQWLTDPDQRKRWQVRLEEWADRFVPPDPEIRHQLKVRVFRVIALADIALALYYFAFRYTRSINVNALWFAIPLLIAETYSFIDTLLFIFMLWKPPLRKTPPPLPGRTVDVFITTYNEPVELVRITVEAALRIRYPHHTYVLDDGNRPELRAVCEEIGCGYITRGPEWEGRPRHAKAGNVNNALMHTSGEFILILDADQVPAPNILHRTLGYFRDPEVAFVQTPQFFYNVPDGDPFGSQAPLFYGPIQQGKDGWNAAFFCGSNAVLRREALMQLGVMRYVLSLERRVTRALSRVPLEVAIRRSKLPARYRQAARRVSEAARQAIEDLRQRQKTLDEVVAAFNQVVEEVQRSLVAEDLRQIAADLAEIEAYERQRVDQDIESKLGVPRETVEQVLGNVYDAWDALTELLAPENPTLAETMSIRPVSSARQAIEAGLMQVADDLAEIAAPPVDLIGLDDEVMDAIRMEDGEALEVQPLVTYSITEDMATAMQLHALGWKSVFHPEILAYGLAPEDLGSALGQRLRWAAGTIQVMLRDFPLTKPGLSWPQRLMYFATMYSYFSGFVSLVYLISPIIYLFTGIPPVTSFAGEFLVRITPYLLLNKAMFQFAAWGMDTVRGEQYSLALFPLWIRAVVTVLGGAKLKFKVTPKTRRSGVFLNLVIPQLTIAVLLALGSLYALFSLAVGWRNDLVGVLINIGWAAYDIWMLSVILKAAVFRTTMDRSGKPPAWLFPEKRLEPRPEAISLSDWRARKVS